MVGNPISGVTFNIADEKVKASARDLVPKRIFDEMEKDKDVYYVMSDASIPGSWPGKIKDTFPNRGIDVGIAEPNLVGAAAGIALAGKKVIATAFGAFLSMRTTDHIHTDVAYNDVPVCLVATHGGVTSGGGPTHYSIIDYAIMSSIPNMTMIAPADANQSVKVIEEYLKNPRPMYVRVSRGEEPLVYKGVDYEYVIGKAIIAKEGMDATLIGTGIGVYNSLLAAKHLEREGINVRVLDMHTIKPIDKDAIIKAARDTGTIITVEDHNIIGGLGGSVATVLADAGVSCNFKRLGIPDVFAKLGSPEDIYEHYGYDSQGIIKHIKEFL